MKFKSKMVYQYDLQGNYLKTYESVKQASKENHCSFGAIARACRGERKTCIGYIWSYERREQNA